MSCIPNGIVLFLEGDRIIQEGADNMDINAETISRKNTFHSMARAVFQYQQESLFAYISFMKVKRRLEKSLTLE